MATNRYDRPIESEYISQYTPIPFELLYAIGKANNERVDKTYLELGGQLSKWAEFRSPSAVDTNKWYDLTIGSAQDTINKLASNPDLIKTAEGRAMIQSFINSRPYDLLSLLLSSREGLAQRQRVIAEMKAKGLYNPNWDDIDILNWNTLDNGIMTDIAPVLYQSLHDIADPYAKNIEARFYKGVAPISGTKMPFTNWMAVTKEDLDRQFTQHINDIQNTPLGRLWYRDIANSVISTNPNATKLDIDAAFINALSTSQSDRINEKPLSDQIGFQMYMQAQKDRNLSAGKSKKSGKGSSTEEGSRPADFTDVSKLSGITDYNSGTEKYIADRFARRASSIRGMNTWYGDNILGGGSNSLTGRRTPLNPQLDFTEIEKDIYNDVKKLTSMKDQFRYYFDDFANELNDGKYNSASVLQATQNILDLYTTPILNQDLREAYIKNIGGIEGLKDTDFGKNYVMYNTSGMKLATVSIAEKAGLNLSNMSPTIGKLLEDLKNNKFSNVIIRGVDNSLQTPDRLNSKAEAVVTASIPLDELKAQGFTEEDLVRIGGKIDNVDEFLESISTRYIGKRDDKNKVDTQTVSTKGGIKQYVTFQLTTDVSSKGINKEYANAAQHRQQLGMAGAGELQPEVQWNAYENDYYPGLIDSYSEE